MLRVLEKGEVEKSSGYYRLLFFLFLLGCIWVLGSASLSLGRLVFWFGFLLLGFYRLVFGSSTAGLLRRLRIAFITGNVGGMW